MRSSVPAPTPVQRAQVDTAVRQVCDAVAADLPAPWQRSVRAAAAGRSDDVRDRLDQAVVGTDLGVDRVPLWWRAGAALQWLLAAAAVRRRALAAGGWGSAATCGCRTRRRRSWRVSPVPTLLLVGGVLLGLLLALRRPARSSAAVPWPAARRAESRLRAAIEQVADELMLGPVEAELARHARARLALERARTG